MHNASHPSNRNINSLYALQRLAIIPDVQIGNILCEAHPYIPCLHPEDGERTAHTGSACIFLFTHPLLPFFVFHLYHHQCKGAVLKALTTSQAQEDGLPLTPGETEDSQWRGQAHTSHCKWVTEEWLWSTPTHSPKYPSSNHHTNKRLSVPGSNYPTCDTSDMYFVYCGETYSLKHKPTETEKGKEMDGAEEWLSCYRSKMKTSTHGWSPASTCALWSAKGQQGDDHNDIAGQVKSTPALQVRICPLWSPNTNTWRT